MSESVQNFEAANDEAPAIAAAVAPLRMLLSDDDEQILGFALASMRAGMGAALVTLSGIRTGAARSLGAHMAVRADGGYCGFVSGGCVEAAVAMEAVRAIETGRDRECVYGEGSPYFDVVLPCGGGITLTIHVLRSPDALQQVLTSLRDRRRAGTRYSPATQRLEAVSGRVSTGWRGSDFDRSYRPRARLLAFARSIELATLTALAEASGYEVVVGEALRGDELQRWVDEDTAVVLLYHDPELERPALTAALGCKPFYIGALGSSRTHRQRVEALQALGYAERDIARIKAPIGLFPKARDARSLALSILADIAAIRSL